jgi:hypothetical protein
LKIDKQLKDVLDRFDDIAHHHPRHDEDNNNDDYYKAQIEQAIEEYDKTGKIPLVSDIAFNSWCVRRNPEHPHNCYCEAKF